MKYTILSLLTLGALALTARAQDNNGNEGMPPGGGFGGPRGHHHPPLPIVTALDTNHDGVLDAAEIANASAALKTLDQNGDGVLTTNEYLPTRPKNAPANAPKPPMPLIVKALDANGDGVIDASEIANASAALKALDKNGDGVLTPDEYLGHPPQHGGMRGMGGGDEGGGPGGDEGGAGGPPEGAPEN